MKKLVIIPVFNEAATLEHVLEEILYYHTGDVVAVDDGSTDGSAAILEACAPVRVIRHETNLGYGRSLIDGFDYAIDNGYDLAVTIDCDDQHEPCMIPRMFARIGSADVLSGSRYLEPSVKDTGAPAERRRINMLMTEAINRVTGFGLTDSFCGFKCYRVEALTRLSLDEPGYAQPLQFWVQAKHFGLTIEEIPVPLIYQHLDRRFGGDLDDPQSRLAYYRRVLDNELKKWSMCLSSECIQTT